MKLENKTILITGAGSGLGRELAYQLKNNQLILVDINKITLRETILNVENKCIEYIMDCSIENNWKNLHEFLKSKNALPDIIINNAARNMSDIDIENLDIDDFRTIFNNNFYSVFFGSKEFISDMKSKNSKCAIVNISSALGFCAIAKAAAYNASKFAINAFGQTLRQELKNTNILVSTVFPGSMPTNIANNGLLAKDQEITPKLLDMIENFKKNSWTKTDKAATEIIKGIKRNKQRILIGLDAKLMDFASRLTPVLYDIIMLREAKKIFK